MSIIAIKINENNAIKRFAINAIMQVKKNPTPFIIVIFLSIFCGCLLQSIPFMKHTVQVLMEIFLFILLAEVSYSNSVISYSFKSFRKNIELVFDFLKKIIIHRLVAFCIIIGISILFDMFSFGSSIHKSSSLISDDDLNFFLNLSLSYNNYLKWFSISFHNFALFILFLQTSIVTDDYFNYRQTGSLATNKITVKNPSSIVNRDFIMKVRYPFLFVSLIISIIPVLGLLMSCMIILMMMQYTYESYSYSEKYKNSKNSHLKAVK